MDIPALVQAELPGLRPMACANLPYYITSPVLTALLEARCFSSVTVMVQKGSGTTYGGGPRLPGLQRLYGVLQLLRTAGAVV